MNLMQDIYEVNIGTNVQPVQLVSMFASQMALY